MPSPRPLENGQYWHIYNRGNNRDNIFFAERNYRYFLKLYAKYFEPVADTYAYCLLPNHFHFLVRTKTVEEQKAHDETLGVFETPRVWEPKNPSQQLGSLFNAYAKAINKRCQRTGSLSEHPFGRVPVASDAHFVYLIAYIHQNPQKHGLADDFPLWPYSSYHALTSTKPTRLKRDDVLAWFGGPAELQASHRLEIRESQIAPLVPDDLD